MAIARDPLVVSPETTALDAMTRMSERAELVAAASSPQSKATGRYAIVIDADRRVVGLFTERDALRLTVQRLPLEQLTLREIPLDPPAAIRESALTDCAAVLKRFQQDRQLDYLLLLDDADRLIGAIDRQSLQWAQSTPRETANGERSPAEEALRDSQPPPVGDDDALLKDLAAGIAAATGEEIFPALARHIGKALGVSHTLVTQFVGDRLQSLAWVVDGELQPNFTAELSETLCSKLIDNALYYCPSGLAERFPKHPMRATGVESYLGVALRDRAGQALGGLCVFDRRPLQQPERVKRILEIFGGRAAAEIERQRTETTLQNLIAGTAPTGKQFFAALVQHIAIALQASHAFVTEVIEGDRLHILAAWGDSQYLPGNIIKVQGTTCEIVLREGIFHCDRDVATRFPNNPNVAAMQVESYQGIALQDCKGRMLGTLCIYSRQPISDPKRSEQILQVFATRAAAELERQRSEEAMAQLNQELEARVRDRTTQLQVLSERLELAIQSAQIGIWEWDYPNNRLSWNERMFAIYGVQPEEFAGTHQDWEKRVHPDDLTQALQKAPVDADRHVKEFRIIRPDGTIRHIFSTASLQRDERGQLVRAVGTNIDISDRKIAERALRKSENRFRTLVANIDAVVYHCRCDRDWTMGYMSPPILELSGYPANEFIGNCIRTYESIIHPKDREYVWQGIEKSTPTDPTFLLEYRILHRNGETRWVSERGKVIFNRAGQAKSLEGVIFDISDRKQADKSLQLTQFAIDKAAVGVFWIGEDGNFLDVNDSACSDLGYNHNELKGRYVWDINPDLQPQEWSHYWQDIQQNNFVRHEVRHQHKDGSISPFEVVSNYLEYEGEGFIFAQVQNIRDRKQAEIQLKQSNEELARATRLKNEFLANMSHELRTPLNAILGMAEGLQEGVFGPIEAKKQIKALRTIERSGAHLLELINDILDLAKIESGHVELEYSPVAAKMLCKSSLAFVRQQAQKKRIKLQLQVAPKLPDIEVDERRVRQVLINLLNNAVKFTPEAGSVTLEVALLPPDAPCDRSSLRFAVTDTGIGIAPEDLKKLFKPFVQVDSSLNRQYQGTGLGLALVKRIAELHEGRVTVTSEVGVGSCFAIELPYATPEPGSLLSPDAPTPSPVVCAIEQLPVQPFILLAEDNEANILTLSSYLQAKGYRVRTAKNGQAAIELAQAEPPDIILMDVQMPGMDGLAAIAHIRKLPNLDRIPIVALTALAMEGDRERCLAAGATAYLSKPVRLRQLVFSIQELLSQ